MKAEEQRKAEAQGMVKILCIAAVIGVIYFVVTHVWPTKEQQAVNPTSTATAAPATASAQTVAPDVGFGCREDAVQSVGVKGLSVGDGMKICGVLTNSLTHTPSKDLFLSFGEAVYAFNAKGSTIAPEDLTGQLMRIAGYLGKHSDSEIDHAIDLAFRCFSASSGHVTPQNMEISLHAMGAKAKSIDDDTVFLMCSMIQEKKKSLGM